jgi:hypothetical protein
VMRARDTPANGQKHKNDLPTPLRDRSPVFAEPNSMKAIPSAPRQASDNSVPSLYLRTVV